MKAEHRYMVAFIAASLRTSRIFTHVHDHDAGGEIAVGGQAQADKVDLIEAGTGARITGAPPNLYHHGSQAYINLVLEDDGFSGYDYASERHFSGRFVQGAVQLYDHETGRYHDFHIS